MGIINYIIYSKSFRTAIKDTKKIPCQINLAGDKHYGITPA